MHSVARRALKMDNARPTRTECLEQLLLCHHQVSECAASELVCDMSVTKQAAWLDSGDIIRQEVGNRQAHRYALCATATEFDDRQFVLGFDNLHVSTGHIFGV